MAFGLIRRKSSTQQDPADGLQAAEARLEAYYREQGYRVARANAAEREAGIDLILEREGERLLLQCRHWHDAQVSNNAVHQLLALLSGHGANGAVLVTAGHFTSAALKAAARAPSIRLIDSDTLRIMLGEASAPASAGAQTTLHEVPHAPPQASPQEIQQQTPQQEQAATQAASPPKPAPAATSAAAPAPVAEEDAAHVTAEASAAEQHFGFGHRLPGDDPTIPAEARGRFDRWVTRGVAIATLALAGWLVYDRLMVPSDGSTPPPPVTQAPKPTPLPDAPALRVPSTRSLPATAAAAASVPADAATKPTPAPRPVVTPPSNAQTGPQLAPEEAIKVIESSTPEI